MTVAAVVIGGAGVGAAAPTVASAGSSATDHAQVLHEPDPDAASSLRPLPAGQLLAHGREAGSQATATEVLTLDVAVQGPLSRPLAGSTVDPDRTRAASVRTALPAPATEGTADPAGSPDGTGDAGGAPVYEAADGEPIDAQRIEAFLDGRGSPLAERSETIVEAGVEHDVDPRVVVAIAVAESNAGERLPSGSHNAWGWGGSGPHGLAHWDSWEESIDAYTERLGTLYDTDAVDVDLAQTYCPPNWRWWLDTVTWAVDAI